MVSWFYWPSDGGQRHGDTINGAQLVKGSRVVDEEEDGRKTNSEKAIDQKSNSDQYKPK